MLQHTAELVIWRSEKICTKVLKHKLQLVQAIQRVSPRAHAGCKGIRSLTIPEKISATTPLSNNNDARVEMLPDRENRAAGIVENKSQNPEQTCVSVMTAYKCYFNQNQTH